VAAAPHTRKKLRLKARARSDQCKLKTRSQARCRLLKIKFWKKKTNKPLTLANFLSTLWSKDLAPLLECGTEHRMLSLNSNRRTILQVSTTCSGLMAAVQDSKTQHSLQMAAKLARKTCSTPLEMVQSSKFTSLICYRIMGAGPSNV